MGLCCRMLDQHLVQCLFFLEVWFEFELTATHLPGRMNTLADDLSRNRLSHFLSKADAPDPAPTILQLACQDYSRNARDGHLLVGQRISLLLRSWTSRLNAQDILLIACTAAWLSQSQRTRLPRQTLLHAVHASNPANSSLNEICILPGHSNWNYLLPDHAPQPQLPQASDVISICWKREHGHSIPVHCKCAPPLQICPKLAIQPDMMMGLRSTRGT